MSKLIRIEKGIYETATGYQVKVTVKGTPFNTFVRELGAARIAKAQAIDSLEKGLVPEKLDAMGRSSNSFDAAFERTWKMQWSLCSQGYREEVVKAWGRLRAYIVDEMGIYTIDKFDTYAVDNLIYHLRTDLGNSESTINNKMSLISAMCNRMVRDGVMLKGPSIPWQDKSVGRLRYYTHEEEGSLIELASDEIVFHDPAINVLLADFIQVLFFTGMRPWMECWNMQIKWLTKDLKGNPVIRIPAEYSKNNIERTIPASGKLLEIIQRRSDGRKGNARVFDGLDKKWHCQRFWNTTARPYMGWGDEEVWYCIRHTFATRLCEAGANLRVVQALMGHSDINQTARYAKATDGGKTEAMLLLQALAQTALQTSHQTDGLRAV